MKGSEEILSVRMRAEGGARARLTRRLHRRRRRRHSDERQGPAPQRAHDRRPCTYSRNRPPDSYRGRSRSRRRRLRRASCYRSRTFRGIRITWRNNIIIVSCRTGIRSPRTYQPHRAVDVFGRSFRFPTPSSPFSFARSSPFPVLNNIHTRQCCFLFFWCFPFSLVFFSLNIVLADTGRLIGVRATRLL